ncbi:hypothetical protein [Streptomyces chartreusis]|uniref:hypothetical protein n=1 Tax=Streptomyces chartreusis TaxID=1969 RepID=UPI0036AA253C
MCAAAPIPASSGRTNRHRLNRGGDRLFDFEAAHKDWLVISHRSKESSLLKRALADFAAAVLAHLTRVIKRKLKKIQYRPHLITGCLPSTGLDLHGPIETPNITDSTRVIKELWGWIRS